ncbi:MULTISPECIES: hypothetical protein [Vibrio]|uniref:hypothetical protein n=1 Tax=Vibrio TaxID=662 RepID=UPI00078C3D84|nr:MULTISPECIES: hypothetical protein [Vibrio]BAU70937.1 hypothetical protein [Vibrio sp. 04Ya108]BBM67805.1 hypothetical protein VA249_44510 [Vibrio alfacsensis]BCN26976.1 hypothetical protein VYA_41680 [Vibrio alfacsensis]
MELEYLEPQNSRNEAHIDLTVFKSVETVSALLLHEVETSRGSQMFMTEHSVRDGAIGCPKNVNLASVIQQLSTHLHRTQRASSRKFLDNRVLYRGAGEIMFYVPPMKHRMIFQSTKKSLLIPMAAHVMFYTNGQLSTYAIKGNERPTPDTELFKTVIPNSYDNSTLCFGSNKRPDIDSDTVMEDLTDIAFCSVSNSTHIAMPLKDVSATELNRYLIKTSGNDHFDEEKLVPLNYTLNRLLEI